MKIVARSIVADLLPEGPRRRLILSQYDRLMTRLFVDGLSGSVFFAAFVEIAPNLLVELSRHGLVPVSELAALNAIRASGHALESPAPRTANVRRIDTSRSIAATRFAMRFEEEARRRRSRFVPAKTTLV